MGRSLPTHCTCKPHPLDYIKGVGEPNQRQWGAIHIGYTQPLVTHPYQLQKLFEHFRAFGLACLPYITPSFHLVTTLTGPPAFAEPRYGGPVWNLTDMDSFDLAVLAGKHKLRPFAPGKHLLRALVVTTYHCNARLQLRGWKELTHCHQQP